MLSGSGALLILLAVVGLIIFFVVRWYNKFKFPKVNCISLVTGGVKSGKSTFALGLALSLYKKEKRHWKIQKFFASLLHREIPEEPLLYSNIPLKVPFVPITQSILLRKTRPNYHSVFYINETSLVADSQLFKDQDINECLTLFFKLFGHETLGSKLICDTQCISDCHFSLKRCLSEYFYIHHTETRIPFFIYCLVREERYSDDNSTINAYTDDVETSLKKVLIRKSVWKKFDAFCYSALTDDCPVENTEIYTDDLKARDIVSFRTWRHLYNEKEND